MNSILYTIGYEGSDIAHFLLTLQQCGIKRVIDVREVPLSRKRGFSKTALAAKLVESGIDYSHFKALGDPKPGRDAMRRGDFSAFVDIYSEHLATPEAQAALHDAVDLAMRSSSGLLCFERSPKECHRTMVEIGSTALRERGGPTVKN